tara:strand:+ start:459 stop:1298 length:840 start_codon:yes stop_codon:yes gene_type:complete
MEQLQTTNDAKSVIHLLDQLNTQNSAAIWIPSLGKEIAFKQMAAKHQKDVIRTLAGTKYFPSALVITLHDIIFDTLMDDSVEKENFTTIDKLAVLLGLRAHNVSDTIELTEVERVDGAEIEGEIKKKISITDHLTRLRKAGDKIKPNTPAKLSVPGLEVIVSLPKFGTEYKFEKYLHDQLRANSDAGADDIMATVFINTLTQFIQSVSTNGQTFEYKDYTPDDCVTITQQLPQRMLQTISDELDPQSLPAQKFTKVPFTQDKVKYIGQIPIDGTFFLAE